MTVIITIKIFSSVVSFEVKQTQLDVTQLRQAAQLHNKYISVLTDFSRHR